MFPHQNEIVHDWVRIGTMLVVSHLLAGGDLMDRAWQMATLYTLLGFTAYRLVTQDLVPTHMAGDYRPVADDWAQFGTMMVVSRLLSGESLMDAAWQRASLFTLLGFSAYQLVTARFISGGATATGATINDAAKFGTMFLVSRLLAGGDLMDRQWQMASLFTILGFATYNFATSRLEAMLI